MFACYRCSDPGAVRPGGHADRARVGRLGRGHRAPAGRVAAAVPAGAGLRGRRGEPGLVHHKAIVDSNLRCY